MWKNLLRHLSLFLIYYIHYAPNKAWIVYPWPDSYGTLINVWSTFILFLNIWLWQNNRIYQNKEAEPSLVLPNVTFFVILTHLCQLYSVSFLLCILFPGFRGFTCTSAERFSFFQSVWSCYKTVRALEWIWNLFRFKAKCCRKCNFCPFISILSWMVFLVSSAEAAQQWRRRPRVGPRWLRAVSHKCTLAPLTLFYCKMWWGDGNHTKTQLTINHSSFSRHIV